MQFFCWKNSIKSPEPFLYTEKHQTVLPVDVQLSSMVFHKSSESVKRWNHRTGRFPGRNQGSPTKFAQRLKLFWADSASSSSLLLLLQYLEMFCTTHSDTFKTLFKMLCVRGTTECLNLFEFRLKGRSVVTSLKSVQCFSHVVVFSTFVKVTRVVQVIQ